MIKDLMDSFSNENSSDSLKRIYRDAAKAYIRLVINFRESIKELELQERAAQERGLTSNSCDNSAVQTSTAYGSAPRGTMKALIIRERIEDAQAVIDRITDCIKYLDDGKEQDLIESYCEGVTLQDYARRNHLGKSRKIKYFSDQALEHFGKIVQDNLIRSNRTP